MEVTGSIWGTWEELVLGGAVLRHGTAAWATVAGEFRDRTLFPALFSPQECKAKYEDLKERYSGCDAWFEELRKQRVAELKKELEKSEDCIGTLQSKLESLNTERESNISPDYNISRTVSPLPTENAEGLDSLSKEASRDESSAGSYMGETGRDWSQERRISASVSSQEDDRKEDLHESCRGSDIMQGIFRKKRGQRKRKSCTIVKEGRMGENSMVSVDRKDPLLGCDQDVGAPEEGLRVSCTEIGAPQQDLRVSCTDVGAPSEDSGGRVKCKHSSSVLTGIMDSIMKHECVSIFGRRLESQKGGRYNMMIRQHVDLENISLRIDEGSISSSEELFRDLLLLATNAVVFYPKSSPEHKSATTLRCLVSQAWREHLLHAPVSGGDGRAVPVLVENKKPLKPQSLQTCSRKVPASSAEVSGKVAGYPVSEDGKKKGCRSEAPAESLFRKRVVGGRGVKRGRGGGVSKRGRESPEKGRKRGRRR